MQRGLRHIVSLGRSFEQRARVFQRVAAFEHRLLGAFFIRCEPRRRSTQAGKLIGTGDDAAAARRAAARERAAGVHNLAVQRDDADAVARAARHGDRMAQRLRDDGAAKEIADNIVITRIAAHEIRRNADISRGIRRHVV